MKRTEKKQIRWFPHEIETIDKIRGHQDFSDFVREAAMESAIKIIGELQQNNDV